MVRRVLPLAVAVALGSALLLGSARPARAQNTGVTIATVPVMILTAVAILSGCTSDEVGEGFNRDGGYIGVGGAWALENFGIDGNVGNAAAVNAQLGYRCHPYLSTELSFEHTTGFDANTPAFAPDVTPWTFFGNGKVHLMTGRVQPYLLAGLGILHADSKNGVTVKFGGGVDLYATENWAVGAGIAYLVPYDAVEDFDYVSFSLGLGYRF